MTAWSWWRQPPTPADSSYDGVMTYSIVARDPSGALGMAVQSHWFSVGSIVPWVEAEVGAVVIQSIPNPAHGPKALELLKSGIGAPDVLEMLLADDPEREFRQIGIVDATGAVATHTGSSCILAAGHQLGDGFSTQANIMDRDTVWEAMAGAFEDADGDLAERLLVALEAAEAEGGDLRGRQSAAIVVVAPTASGIPGEDRIFDLRVEDHPDPVGELRRLVELRRAYLALIEGDDLVSKGDLEAALGAYRSGMDLLPEKAINGEAAFWTGITLAGAGRVDEAIPYLVQAQELHDAWARLVPRLTASGILPDDPDLIGRLVSGMQGGVASSS